MHRLFHVGFAGCLLLIVGCQTVSPVQTESFTLPGTVAGADFARHDIQTRSIPMGVDDSYRYALTASAPVNLTVKVGGKVVLSQKAIQHYEGTFAPAAGQRTFPVYAELVVDAAGETGAKVSLRTERIQTRH